MEEERESATDGPSVDGVEEYDLGPRALPGGPAPTEPQEADAESDATAAAPGESRGTRGPAPAEQQEADATAEEGDGATDGPALTEEEKEEEEEEREEAEEEERNFTSNGSPCGEEGPAGAAAASAAPPPAGAADTHPPANVAPAVGGRRAAWPSRRSRPPLFRPTARPTSTC